MENKKIIIILVAIIVILVAAIGFVLLGPLNAKEPCQIKITSDKVQYEGGELSIKLTDLNKTPISKQIVNVTITNKNGKVVVDDAVKTNSKGNAKLDLNLKKGKYNVTVTYSGNENYTANNTAQKLTIKQEVKKTVSESSTKNYPQYNPSIGYYRSTGITQQEMGVLELSSGQYIVVAGDGYYEYGGLDSQGNIIRGSFLGH